MTDTPGDTERDMVPDLPIEFKSRIIQVKMPSPEQLLVWRRTLRQLQGADVNGWNAGRVMDALERTRKIVDSVMVNTTDVDWLDDEMLSGSVTLPDMAEIIQKTVEAFTEASESEGNRETRRAAKKPSVKKAARKAPKKEDTK